MTLQEIIADIHALSEDLEAYEPKYGELSEMFYEAYISGKEPGDNIWALDWADWAGAYKTLLRRQDTELLLGKRISSDKFCDYNVGHVLDKAYEIGSIKIFTAIEAGFNKAGVSGDE